MIQRVVGPVIHWANTSLKLILPTILTTMGLNVLTADSYVAILPGGRMFQEAYINQKLKPVILSGAIADSGSIVSPVIPGNVHGAFAAGALGMSVLNLALYAFICYRSLLVTAVLASISLRKETLPEDADAEEIYEEAPDEANCPRRACRLDRNVRWG